MASLQELLSASTNCYKLASLSEIKYTVFSHPNSDDKVLLDAELALRKKSPKVLATLYGKELWTFSMDQEDPPIVDDKFSLKQTTVQSFSPGQIFRNSNGASSSLMPILIVTFLKSLKRLLINNLSSRKEIVPFGNAGLLPDYTLLQIEPRVLENGDITISIITNDQNLRDLNEISRHFQKVNDNYAIYLAPSGIRVYLADSTIDHSITVKPPNYSFIIESLALLHNIQIDPEQCTWVKVIPNLSHLNGMTCQISDYLKPVSNIKYISWPLELCLIQEADNNNSIASFDWRPKSSDPLSLIDDFVNLKATSHTKTPSTVPTANNTPMALENQTTDYVNEFKHPQDPGTVTSTTNGPGVSPVEVATEHHNEPVHDNWSDLDEELFGEGGEVTDNDFDFFNETENNNDNNDNNNTSNNNDSMMINDLEIPQESVDEEVELDDDLFDDDDAIQNDNLASELELLTENDIDKKNELLTEETITKDPYDIPVHEMTVPLYTDPGAPLPIETPIIPSKKRSIFSPLNFNPIIKSNVDDKYANGGKFFVRTVETPINESSIPMVTLADSFGQDEGDDDDSEEDDDDGYSNSSDEDDEQDAIKDHDIMDLDTIATPIKSGGSLEPETKRLRYNDTPLDSNETPLSNGGGSMSPEASNGVPNPLPFLLRSIPIHSIPPIFFKQNPTLSENEIVEFLDDFSNQIIWNDNSHKDLFSSDTINKFGYHDSIVRAIAQVFPHIHKENLSEFANLPNESIGESPLSTFKDPDYTHTSNLEFNSNTSPMNEQKLLDSSNIIFPIPQSKLRVKRLSQEISVNSSALHFWNLMSFNSLNDQKDVRIILITPKTLLEQSDFFLSSLVQIYEKCQLGSVERISIPSLNINDGLVVIDVDNLESSIIQTAQSIHENFIKSSNYKDVLLIFPNFNNDLNSTVKIIKLFKLFKSSMTSLPNGKSLPIKTFLKIIPSSYIANRGVLSVVSTNLLTRLSLSIYNSLADFNSTYCSLSVPMPDQINFQLTKQPVASEILAQDSFIHLAYERSIDKEWLVAAWSDEYSTIREVKSWNCSSKVKNNLENVMNNIWSNCLEIASKLPGKTYLVLVRSDGTIPDDELLQWKRLSSKSRELTLVVISANQDPSLLLQLKDPVYPIKKIFNQDESFNDTLISNKVDSVPTVGSTSGMTPSSIFTPQPVNSPDLFTISKSGNHDSPSDSRIVGDDQGIIVDAGDLVYGILMDGPNSLANSPIRLGVKTGYLIKSIPNSKNRLKAFELNLMSCPGTLAVEEFMKSVLVQFRNLATIAELLCVTNPNDALIPWHILAVRKNIICLSHIRVENGEATTN